MKRSLFALVFIVTLTACYSREEGLIKIDVPNPARRVVILEPTTEPTLAMPTPTMEYQVPVIQKRIIVEDDGTKWASVWCSVADAECIQEIPGVLYCQPFSRNGPMPYSVLVDPRYNKADVLRAIERGCEWQTQQTAP